MNSLPDAFVHADALKERLQERTLNRNSTVVKRYGAGHKGGNEMGRLKDLRCNRGLTQERLADEIGTSQQTISRIEGKGDLIPVDLLVRLSRYYNVSVDYLLGLSDEKYNQASRDRMTYYMEKYEPEFTKYDVLNPEYQEIVKSVIYTLSELQEKQSREKRGA